MKRIIQIKTNLLTIVIVCFIVVAGVVIYGTNSVQNLCFASLSADRVSAITVHQQFDQEEAQLLEADVKTLVQLLRKVRLTGRSVRLSAAENNNPQYTVRLKNGISFQIACYEDHYIINGRGYPISDQLEDNYAALGRLYMEHLENRTYFPRETSGEG